MSKFIIILGLTGITLTFFFYTFISVFLMGTNPEESRYQTINRISIYE